MAHFGGPKRVMSGFEPSIECARCGAGISPRSRFCPECGTPLVPQAAARGETHPIRSISNRGGRPPSASILLVVAVVLAFFLGWVFLPRLVDAESSANIFDALGRDYGPSCTVGVTGTAATLTFKGWNAWGSCDAQLASAGLYRSDAATLTAPIICQYTTHGMRATIRDEGSLKLVGNVLCQSLRKQVN